MKTRKRSKSVVDESDFPFSISVPPSLAVSTVHASPMEWRGCNCKHSKCLKLYCECFASGTYCDDCGCNNCRNNFENESARQDAISLTLERKPNAFRRMAGQHLTLNTEDPAKSVLMEGCNCKRSRCLKKYCNCFRANSLCSEKCRCMDCNNFEGCEERLAFDIGKDASLFTKVEQENLVIDGAVEHSSYRPFQDSMNRNDQNLQGLNKEDPLTGEAAQTHQPFAPATMDSSVVTYRSLLADLVQPHDIRELSAHLVIVSDANKHLKDVYAQQERLVLGNFCDYLIKLMCRGKAKERQVSMSIRFDTENQNESVVLDHEEELRVNQRSPEMES